MKKKELKKSNEGGPETEIEREARAVLFFFLMTFCAILVCALTIVMCYGLYELVKYIVG